MDELKHIGKVQDYAHAFQVLDLECTRLNDFEKLYLFMRNMQPNAADELRCQRVQTLAKAIAAANHLLDYKGDAAKAFGGTQSDNKKARKSFKPRNVPSRCEGQIDDAPLTSSSCDEHV